MLSTVVCSEVLLKKVKDNGGYCLCAVRKTRETRCQCPDFRAQAVPGKCHCGVFEKVEDYGKKTRADVVAAEQAERRRDDLTGHDL